MRSSIYWGLFLYVCFGALWIVASDNALLALGLDPEEAARLATAKGLLFVLISALWALLMLRMTRWAPAVEAAGVPPADATLPRLDLWLMLLALLVPLVGAGVYTLQLKKLEGVTRRSLQGTAEISASQLGRLLNERHVDAAVFALDETRLAALRSNRPVDVGSDSAQQVVLLAAGFGYSRVELIDRQGRSLLSHELAPVLLDEGDERQGLLLLQTSEDTGSVSLSVRSYVRRSMDGLLLQLVVELVEAGQPLGRVEFWQPITDLLLGPGSLGSRLFPSEEIVLGRRSGEELVLVARRKSEPAVEARLERRPASSEALIGRLIGAEVAGQAEGVDYRGEQVLAGHAPLAGGDWHLLVKVDHADLRASLMPLVGWIIAVMVLYAGMMAISLNALWSRERQLEALRARAQSTAMDRLLQQFFNLPVVGIAFTSPTSKRWMRFNERLCEILGYPRAELETLTWAEITHTEDLPSDISKFESLLRGESDSYAMRKRFIRKDGSVVHAYIDVHGVRREDGSIEVFVVTIDDITADELARQALELSHQRLQRVVEESPHPTLVLAEDGSIRLLSRSWCELSGYPAEQLATIDDWLRLAHPGADRAAALAHVRALFEAVGRVDHGEASVLGSDGSEMVWQFSTMPLGPGPDGRREIVTTGVDITAQRRATAELRQSERLYRQMFDDNPICMYVFEDGSLRILAANSAMQAAYGWSREQLLGMSIEQLRPAADVKDLHVLLAGLRPDRINRPGVLTHQRRDGSRLRAEVAVHAMKFRGRKAWMVMAVDVTEREHYVSKLEHAASSTLAVVATMVELRDPYTAGHERRVGLLAAAIAGEMGLDRDMQQALVMCGAVHDVGKVAVPAEILSKPMRLSAAEYEIIKQHAQQGYDILKAIELPWPLAEVARQHHERMDGSGYPRGLKGGEILLEARIVAVADVVESMSSHRPYRPAIGPALALAEIEANSGRLYDPDVASACLRLFREKGYGIPA